MKFQEKPIPFGRVTKTHGVHGAFVVLSSYDLDSFEELPEWCFLLLDGALVPFQLVNDDCFVKDDKQVVIRVTGVFQPEHIYRYLGAEVFFPEAVVEALAQERGVEFDLIGYQVIIEPHGKEGRVIDFLDISENPLWELEIDGAVHLIPVAEEFITSLDERNRILYLTLPEGLLDLN